MLTHLPLAGVRGHGAAVYPNSAVTRALRAVAEDETLRRAALHVVKASNNSIEYRRRFGQ